MPTWEAMPLWGRVLLGIGAVIGTADKAWVSVPGVNVEVIR